MNFINECLRKVVRFHIKEQDNLIKTILFKNQNN